MNENISFSSRGVADYAQAGAPEDLYARYKLDTEGIVSQLKNFLKN